MIDEEELCRSWSIPISIRLVKFSNDSMELEK
jgi:hypothetical protein